MRTYEDLFSSVKKSKPSLNLEIGQKIGESYDNIEVSGIYPALKKISFINSTHDNSYIRPDVYNEITRCILAGYTGFTFLTHCTMNINNFDFKNSEIEVVGNCVLYANHIYNGKLSNLKLIARNKGIYIGENTSITKENFEFTNVNFICKRGWLCLLPTYYNYKFKKCSFKGSELIIDYSHFNKNTEELYYNRLDRFYKLAQDSELNKKTTTLISTLLDFKGLAIKCNTVSVRCCDKKGFRFTKTQYDDSSILCANGWWITKEYSQKSFYYTDGRTFV